jgi:outer membrane protein
VSYWRGAKCNKNPGPFRRFPGTGKGSRLSKSMDYPEKRLYTSGNLYFLTPMTQRALLLTAIVALSFALAVPAQVPTLSLQDAIRQAVGNNFGLDLARDQTEAAAADRAGGVGAFLPSASASLTNRGDLEGGPSRTSAGASANWVLFNGFQDYNGYRRLKAQEKSTRLEERQSLESLLETVVVSYYDIVQSKQSLAAIRQLLAVSQERATLSQARLEVGAGSRLDQLQSLADLNADSSAFLDAATAMAKAKVRLNQVLARESTLDFDVADSIPLESSPPLDEWRKGLPENNSSIAAARMNRNAAVSGLAAARGGWLPSLTTGVSYNTVPEALNSAAASTSTGGSTESDSWGYSVNLSIPLFDRLGTPTSVRKAKVGVRSSETRIKQAESQAVSDFEQARSQFETAVRRISLEERNLQVSRLQAEAAQERYKLGASSPLEFRDAQTRLLSAEGRLISARQSAKQSEVALQRLAGLLVRQTLGPAKDEDADSAGGK